MILILEVASPQPTAGASRQTFQEQGGSIGRENDNSWVLPHSKVSGLHALITHRNGVYYIEDRSRNGVCLNSSKNRLERGRPYALKAGDRILIDPYEIRVSIGRDHDRAEPGAGEYSRAPAASLRAESSDPFDTDDPFAPRAIDSVGLESPAEQLPDQALDPLQLLDLVPKRAPARKPRSSQDLQLGSVLEGHYRPPSTMPDPALASRAPAPTPPAANTIPEDYDPLAPDDDDLRAPQVPPAWTPEPPPRPPDRPAIQRPAEERAESVYAPVPASEPVEEPPAPPERPAAGANAAALHTADFAAVLEGAGLDPASVTPEIAREFGQILRVVVSGVMDVMRSRQQIKDEFRMQVTRVRPAENNPLKFSANVDDALQNLLMKRSRAYLSPVDAFEDAFADLRRHQIAMLAGMRVAFESMLEEFAPDRLQEEFDRQLAKGLVPAKLRYWDLYREKRQEIVKDPEAAFRRLFGEEFARAYEDQLRKLKAQERPAAGAPSIPPKGRDA